jgi:hypothetical protein
MAMSRSFAGVSFTRRPPMESSPPEIDSRPAIIRSVVLLPQPDGPTSTMNSPSAISRSRSCTAGCALAPSSYILRMPDSFTLAMGISRSDE